MLTNISGIFFVKFEEAALTRFLYMKCFIRKWASKNPQNLKKMFPESPASNAWAAIFKNAWFFIVF